MAYVLQAQEASSKQKYSVEQSNKHITYVAILPVLLQ